MGDSQYYNDERRRFHAEHPAGEGWHVFEINMSDNIDTADIPDFLDLRPPSAATEVNIVRGLKRVVDPNGKLRRRDRYEDWDWRGEIRFAWKGEPIHCRSVTLLVNVMATLSVVLVAAKSRTSVTSFLEELRRFAIARAKRSGMVKVVNGADFPKPKQSWEELFLPPGMSEEIQMSVESFFKAKKMYRQFGLAYRRGFLFAGPPGCGKTSAVRSIASMKQASCVVYAPKNGAREEDFLEMAFRSAWSMAPAILVLEDLDKFSQNISISSILNLLDGLSSLSGILVIATTNEPERLDPALLLRPSRFDRVWTFPLPNYALRLKFLERKAQGTFSPEALKDAARRSEGFSMAYVQEILASAVAYAIGENREIADRDLTRAVDILSKQIKAQVKTYKTAPPSVGGAGDPIGFSLPEPPAGNDGALETPGLDGARNASGDGIELE